MTATLVLLAVLVMLSQARLLAYEGFHNSQSVSNLREIDVATGRVGSDILGTTTTYSGEASCTEQSSGTFTCVGSTWEYGAGNLTIVGADGRIGLFPLPIELRDGHWLSGIGVTTFGDNKYLVGLDDFMNTIVYSISSAPSYSRLSKGTFQSKYGLVDTLVATPTKIWIGLGNTSISHWDRRDYQFAGIDITGKAFSPIITPLSKDISTALCYYSQKEQSPVCLTKRDQVNSPTQLIRLDDATGDIKVLCPKVDGIADNMYLHTSAFDSAGEVFYIVGRAQASEHSNLMRFRGKAKQFESFRASAGAGPDTFITFKLGQCAAQSVPLSGIDPPNTGTSVWQLMVI